LNDDRPRRAVFSIGSSVSVILRIRVPRLPRLEFTATAAAESQAEFSRVLCESGKSMAGSWRLINLTAGWCNIVCLADNDTQPLPIM
jgi:hypothetical protein